MNGSQPPGCGASITEDTTLTADIGPCSGHGLVVEADGVTLDLGGHTISGDPFARSGADKAGILLKGVRGVTVRNGTVVGFDAGVAIQGGGGNAVREVTVEDNVNYRVVTGRNADPDDVNLDEQVLCMLGEGISVANSSDNVIEHNRVYGNGPLAGIALVGDSNDNLVAHNDVADNDVPNTTPDGRPTTCGTGRQQGPMTRGRSIQGIGIRVEGPGADRNVIEHNRVTRSAIAGISVHSYDSDRGTPPNEGTVIRNNRVVETGKTTFHRDPHAHGIAVLGTGLPPVRPPDGVTIEGNTSSRNCGHGIYVAGHGSRGHTVSGNIVTGNGHVGIFLEGPLFGVGVTDSAVRDNRGQDNDVDGVDGNEECGTNRWSGNRFGTVNQTCVAADGTGTVTAPGYHVWVSTRAE